MTSDDECVTALFQHCVDIQRLCNARETAHTWLKSTLRLVTLCESLIPRLCCDQRRHGLGLRQTLQAGRTVHWIADRGILQSAFGSDRTNDDCPVGHPDTGTQEWKSPL